MRTNTTFPPPLSNLDHPAKNKTLFLHDDEERGERKFSNLSPLLLSFLAGIDDLFLIRRRRRRRRGRRRRRSDAPRQQRGRYAKLKGV